MRALGLIATLSAFAWGCSDAEGPQLDAGLAGLDGRVDTRDAATLDAPLGVDVSSALDARASDDSSTGSDAGPPPGFVRVERGAFMLDGRSWHPIGVSYWPHYSQPYYHDSRYDWITMWGSPDFPALDAEAAITEDFRLMRDRGITEIRIQNSWVQLRNYATQDPTSYPTPERSACSRIRRLLDLADEHGLHVTWVAGGGGDVFRTSASQSHAESRLESTTQLVDRCHLEDHPALLGYTLHVEGGFSEAPTAGGYESPEALSQWSAWIDERYGSHARAAARWGYTLPTNCATLAAGQSCPPATLTDDASSAAPAAKAFRRFVATRINKYFQRTAGIVRAHDPNHLITCDSSADDFLYCSPNFPFVTRATTKYLDFASPHIYQERYPTFDARRAAFASGSPQQQRLMRSAATVAYLAPERRPVVVGEFGLSVRDCSLWGATRCIASELPAVQDALFTHDWRVFWVGGAAGARWWWWQGVRPMGALSDDPGGDGEGSDYGMLSAQRSERTALSHVATASLLFFNAPQTVTARVSLVHSVCPSKIVNQAGDVAQVAVTANQRLRIETECSALDSGNAPLTCVDGSAYWAGCGAGQQPCCPLLCLDAMFDQVEVYDATGAWKTVESGSTTMVTQGQPVRVRVRVGNTGDSAWRAGPAGTEGRTGVLLEGVGLAATRGYLDANVASYDSSAPIEMTAFASASGSQAVTLRMIAEGRGVFGEAYSLNFVAQ